MTGKCQLCEIECDLTAHHLIPKLKAKKKYQKIRNDESNIIMVCRQCHDNIHACFSEQELRDYFSTLELLKADSKITKFTEWRKKHANFTGHSKMSNRRKH